MTTSTSNAMLVPDELLTDLRDRLRHTRAPRAVISGWAEGMSPDYLASFCSYWAESFDWRKTERRLAGLPQRMVTIDGTSVHVIHARRIKSAAGNSPIPLVLTHGWPSSFFEFLPLLPMLTNPAEHGADPEDSFDVVIPSLPGFGWSELPVSGPVEPAAIAALWVRVMGELGYERFGAHGGDIGSHVTNFLGAHHPAHIIGLHTHHPNLHPSLENGPPLNAVEQAYVDDRGKAAGGNDYSYAAVQAARPNSLAPGLSDSPAGLAAWILDKYREWSNCGGDLDSTFAPNALAEIVTLYWLTNTIGTSFRPYVDDEMSPQLPPVTVPVAITLTPDDSTYPHEFAARTYTDIRQFRDATVGGHFFALEQPELLAKDLRDFFRPLRGVQ